jgi:hypothetical protein
MTDTESQQSATEGQTLFITVPAGQGIINFSADRSFDQDGVVTGWAWQIDGLDASSRSSFSAELAVGNHTVSLYVIDNQGAQSGEATAQITIITNVQVNTSEGDPDDHHIQNETSIAVFENNVVIGWNDSKFCCELGSFHWAGYGYSTDGGRTFTDGGEIKPFRPLTILDTLRRTDILGDPSVAADTQGNFYYAVLSREYELQFKLRSPIKKESTIRVANSTDGGKNFGPATIAVDAKNSTQKEMQDKEYLAVDRSPSSPCMDRVYLSWTSIGKDPKFDTDIDFGYSTDGGMTFSKPIKLNNNDKKIPSSRNGSVIAVDKAGRVYVAWVDYRDIIGIRVSRYDCGSNSPSGEVDNVLVANVDRIGSLGECGDKALLQGITVNDFPTMAVDNSSGPNNGNIYIAWNDNRYGNPDILMTRSTDGGRTWCPPERVNDDTATNDQFMPSMSVDPNGRLHVIWYDRRRDPAKIDVYYARSTDGGQTFEPNRRLTYVSFGVPNPPNSEAPEFQKYECYMGDYISLASADGRVYAAWGDNRVLDNQGRPDPNVFFSVIPDPVAVFLPEGSRLYPLALQRERTEWPWPTMFRDSSR